MSILDLPGVANTKNGRERLLTQNSAAMQTFWAGLANRVYAPCDIAVLGDSITAGQGATALDRRWIAQLRSRIRTKYPVSGVVGGRGFIGSDNTGLSSFTWPVVAAGAAATIDTKYGLTRNTPVLNTAGQKRTWTLQGTSCDLYYAAGPSTGILAYKINGGSAVTVDTHDAGNSSIKGGYVQHIVLGASGAYTLEVSYSSGGDCYPEGVIEYDGDESTGIRVHDGGHYGYTTSTWANRLGNQYWMNSYGTIGLDLLIFAVNTNDVTNGVSVATMMSNITGLIGAVRSAQSSNPSVLLVPMYQRSDTTPSAWAPYVQAMYTLAAGDAKYAVCDLNARMPAVGLGAASLGLYADTVHPADKGHSMIADLVLGAISPR